MPSLSTFGWLSLLIEAVLSLMIGLTTNKVSTPFSSIFLLKVDGILVVMEMFPLESFIMVLAIVMQMFPLENFILDLVIVMEMFPLESFILVLLKRALLIFEHGFRVTIGF